MHKAFDERQTSSSGNVSTNNPLAAYRVHNHQADGLEKVGGVNAARFNEFTEVTTCSSTVERPTNSY